MRDEVAALPREYLELLREMSKDPNVGHLLPGEVVDTVARQLAMSGDAPRNEVDAMYHRCCVDRIARHDEIGQRVQSAVDEWYADSSNSAGRLGGIPEHVLTDIQTAEHRSFMCELNAWRRRHPQAYFDE